KEKRILHNDWIRYTGGEVVFQPAKMSADKLQEMYHYAWDAFYSDCSQEVKMAKMFLKVLEKEKESGTYRKTQLARRGCKLKKTGKPE
ncbi:MAG: hypothetical protein AAB089_07450, partial [Nitrospirota bacterium]